ncbi:sugar transferase [Escherichia coli]|uniref:sugar transferase n=1 Tax=Escherichia coli TaxID=562 RepID=UPI001E64D54A|nr:sugar transferase [Escherichia coli]
MILLSRNFLVSISLALSDFVSFTISIYLAIAILSISANPSESTFNIGQIDGWILLHWLLAVCCVGWYSIRLRHYFYRKTFWFELKEILRTLVIFAIIEIAVIAFTTWSFSRALWVITWIFILLLVPFSRILTKYLLNKLGYWQRDTWIIGSGNNAIEAYKAIISEKNLGLKIIGFIASEGGVRAGETINGIKVISNDIDWLRGEDKKTQFIVAVESHQSEMRNSWLRNFMIQGFRYVSVIPTLRGMPLDSTDMSFIFSHEVMIFRVQQNLAKWSSRTLKRLFDIIASIAIIILLSPVLLYISRLVKKDGGPAIYGHERIGQDGKPFKCLKFRSMVTNSKDVLNELLQNDPEAKREWDTTFKLKNDPRITKIGAVLRRTSLDELPQLFNVLKGEMSLVGPRPITERSPHNFPKA